MDMDIGERVTELGCGINTVREGWSGQTFQWYHNYILAIFLFCFHFLFFPHVVGQPWTSLKCKRRNDEYIRNATVAEYNADRLYSFVDAVALGNGVVLRQAMSDGSDSFR